MGGFGSGDRLARGAKSANFGSMSHVSQSRWDEIFGKTPEQTEHDKAMGRAANAAFAYLIKVQKPKRQNKNAADSKKAG